jgi:hypothetical protein
MVQFSHARSQATADLSQRLGFAELAKQHTDQLIPAGEPFGVTISSMLANNPTEGLTISKVYDLCKKVCTFKRHMPLRFVGFS